MSAQPLTRVDGVVIGVRLVTIAARASEQYTTAAGEQRTTKAQPERTYFEAGINTAGITAFDSDDIADVGAVLAVTLPDDPATHPAKGTRVSWYVRPKISKYWDGRRFVEWVSHTFTAPVSEARQVLGGKQTSGVHVAAVPA